MTTPTPKPTADVIEVVKEFVTRLDEGGCADSHWFWRTEPKEGRRNQPDLTARHMAEALLIAVGQAGDIYEDGLKDGYKLRKMDDDREWKTENERDLLLKTMKEESLSRLQHHE